MILVADSGSTKTDWALIDGDVCLHQVHTKGMNPFFLTEEELENELRESLLKQLSDSIRIESVYFYGAGCTQEKAPFIESAIRSVIPNAKYVKAHTDMLGAARALCGKKSGIICILGTGSNSCLYDGSNIVSNVSPLGYILGDEGSGAVLGKLFVGDLLKNQLSDGLKEIFMSETHLDAPTIIDKVYRQPMPNRFLASLAPFIVAHLDDKSIYALVYRSFNSFFIRNVMQYDDYKSLQIHFIGSIAYYFRDVLAKVAHDLHLHLGSIQKSPIEGLIKYHVNR